MAAELDTTWLVTWTDECLSRIDRIRKQHARARDRLELEIETQPIESNFSTQLIDLMHREEVASSQGRFDLREQIAQRVDQQLATETQRHFTAQSEVNQRKLAAAFRHQVLERDRFADEVADQMSKICRSLRLPPPDERRLSEGNTKENGYAMNGAAKKRAGGGGGAGGGEGLAALTGNLEVDLEMFAEEERRIAREAQARHGESERFHLENAFNLQLKRVDADWATHEQQMKNDYEAQRAEIEGRRAVQSEHVPAAQGPWKAKEKADKLFNTAPVHSPDAKMEKSPKKRANGVAGAVNARQVEQELQALDAAYNSAKQRVQLQKQNASRWIRRQSQRMYIQLKCVEKDKAFTAQHLEREEVQLNSLARRIRAFADWIAETLAQAEGGNTRPKSKGISTAAGGSGSGEGGGSGGGVAASGSAGGGGGAAAANDGIDGAKLAPRPPASSTIANRSYYARKGGGDALPTLG